MTAQIEVEDLHLHLGSSSGGTNALDGVSLHVNEGQRLGLVGGSGAGKSTLLKAMMALRQPDSGTVRFRGTSLTDANAIRELRRSAAMVFQDPRSSLDPRMSIGRAITEPLRSPDVPVPAAHRRLEDTSPNCPLKIGDIGEQPTVSLRNVENAVTELALRRQSLVSDVSPLISNESVQGRHDTWDIAM